MFEVLDEVCTPTRGTKHSAAIDLKAKEDVVIAAGETVIIPLGVKIDKKKMPIYLQNNKHRHFLQLEPRSSLRAKGLMAGTGIIDLDYEDEIMLVLQNPIQYIDKEIDFDKNDDYIELNYMGSPTPRNGMEVKYSSSFKISKGERVAQILLLEHKSYLFGIDTEDERTGGFGSTGTC